MIINLLAAFLAATVTLTVASKLRTKNSYLMILGAVALSLNSVVEIPVEPFDFSKIAFGVGLGAFAALGVRYHTQEKGRAS